MKNIKVAAIAINQTPLDWGGNKFRIIEALQEAENVIRCEGRIKKKGAAKPLSLLV